jgi:hypothetical protein
LSVIQSQFAKNAALLILKMNEPPYSCTLGEAWRPPEMAAIYAKDGRGTKNSLHCKRLAIDLNLFADGQYMTSDAAHKPFGEWWESLSPFNRWGGRWGDGNHYEQAEVIKI